MKKIKENIKIILISAIFIIGIMGYFIYGVYQENNPDISYKIVQLESRDLSKTISINGQIFSDYEIDLASEIPGIISRIYVKEGDYVKKGQLLMKLKDTDYRSKINTAYVNEQINKASLDKVKNPNQNLEQDIDISQNNKDIINDDIDKIRLDITSNINNLNIYLDQALRLDIDDYFDHTDTNPVFTYRIKSATEEANLEETRVNLGEAFQKYMNLEEKNLSDAIDITEFFEFLIFDLREASVGFLGFSDSELETKEKALSDLRNEIVEKKDELIDYKNQLNQLLKKLDINVVSEEKLENVIIEEDVKLAEQRVKLAGVETSNAYLQLQKTNIKATRDGVIAEIFKDEGEYTGSSSPLVKVISKNKYVRAFVPEVDMEKISLGMDVEIILDAFLKKKFKGVIDFIYPTEKESQGIVYYEIKILLDDDEIKNVNILPGMSLEVFITYKNKQNAVALERIITKKDDNGYFVQILNSDKKKPIDKKFINKYFEYGFIGDKYIEVISGFNENDEIVKMTSGLKKKKK